MLMYGQRGEGNCTIDPSELVRHNKSLEGFRLLDWMRKAGFTRSVKRRCLRRSSGIWNRGAVFRGAARLPLDSYHQALDLLYRGRITDGQIQFSLS